MNTSKQKIEKLTLTALFTALVAVLSYLGGFVKIGGLASINLTLIPVVLGGALLGPGVGAFLGAVAGAAFFLNPVDSGFWIGLSLHGTVITVMIKGILAGYLAALCYKALSKKNKYAAVVTAAVVAPVVNTGIFLVGCLTFFMDAVSEMAAGKDMSIFAYFMVVFVGLNFVFELIANVIASPALLRIINVFKKK